MSITPQPPADFSPEIQDSHFTPPQTGYTGQGSFRFWCQTVLPLVYDDSLSYYELLNKVVHYLNNVISDVASTENNVLELYNSFNELQGNTNTNIELLLGAYNELQSYVNRYFEGLDVQEEINIKLDQLAQNGTLTRLIAPFVPDIIGNWLSEHITPTTPIVDNTLTIPNAAADSKATGDKIENLKADFNEFTGETILYDGSATRYQVLFTSTNVNVGDTVDYYIKLPPNQNLDRDGYIELKDANNNRLGIYGRTAGGNTNTEFNGTFIIPSGFNNAIWNGNETPISIILNSQTNKFIRCDIAQNLTKNEKTQALENIGITPTGEIIYSGSPTNNEIVFDNTDVHAGDILFYDLDFYPYNQSGYIYLYDTNDNILFYIGKPNVANMLFSSMGCFKIPTNFAYAKATTSSGTPLKVNYIKTVVDYSIFAQEYMRVYYGKQVNLTFMCGYTLNKIQVSKTGDLINYDPGCVSSPISVVPGSRIHFNYSLNSNKYGVCYYDMEMNFIGGETSIGKTYYQVPENAYFVQITWLTQWLATSEIYMEPPIQYSMYKTINHNAFYSKMEVHRYGTMFDGYTHLTSAGTCLFDNKIYIGYSLAMRHDPTRGEGSIGGKFQIDTISMDGKITHLKTFTAVDFGFSASDNTRQWYPRFVLTPSKDGQYLIGIVQCVEVVNGSYAPFHVLVAVFNKNLDILQYKVIENCTTFSYGCILITQSGKIAFTTYALPSEHVYLYTSDQPFTGSVNNLTFTQTELLNTQEIGREVNECSIGYFNDKLVLICRAEGNEGAIVKTTSNLDGTSGWSNASVIPNTHIAFPFLLPYYKGQYLPVLASVRKTDHRIPMFGYLDIDTCTFKALKDIDDELLTAFNAATSMIYLDNDNYGILYYQETPGIPNDLQAIESYTGVYFKIINTRALIPEKMYWDFEDNN